MTLNKTKNVRNDQSPDEIRFDISCCDSKSLRELCYCSLREWVTKKIKWDV